MAIGILGPLNGVINQTVGEIVDSQISSKVVKILTTFVSSSFDAVDSVLVKVRDLTKDDTPSGSPSPGSS
jgi:hypothetical protein